MEKHEGDMDMVGSVKMEDIDLEKIADQIQKRMMDGEVRLGYCFGCGDVVGRNLEEGEGRSFTSITSHGDEGCGEVIALEWFLLGVLKVAIEVADAETTVRENLEKERRELISVVQRSEAARGRLQETIQALKRMMQQRN